MTRPANQPISTAPRTGRTIIIGHEDVGEFVMRWDADARNDLFFPGACGFWIAPDSSMTWGEHDDAGPDYWRELSS